MSYLTSERRVLSSYCPLICDIPSGLSHSSRIHPDIQIFGWRGIIGWFNPFWVNPFILTLPLNLSAYPLSGLFCCKIKIKNILSLRIPSCYCHIGSISGRYTILVETLNFVMVWHWWPCVWAILAYMFGVVSDQSHPRFGSVCFASFWRLCFSLWVFSMVASFWRLYFSFWVLNIGVLYFLAPSCFNISF